MVSLAQLWLPILLSAVFVFIASSLLHMVLKFWHLPDYKGFTNEDEVRAAIRKGNAAPGMYVLPHCDMEAMKKPETQEKFKEGPVGFVILRPSGAINMGRNLGQWFAFCVVMSLLSAYLAAHTMAPGMPFKHVFCVLGTAAFMGYALGSLPMGIWWDQPWRAVAKDVIDGLVYALITAGTFGWFWPA
jgi:hypothetical protein